MKRLLSIILVMVMMFTMVTTITAETATDEVVTYDQLVNQLIDELYKYEHREQLYDLIVLYKGASNQDQFFDAYWSSLVSFVANKFDKDLSEKKGMFELMISQVIVATPNEDLALFIGKDLDASSTDPEMILKVAEAKQAFKVYLSKYEDIISVIVDTSTTNGYTKEKEYLDRGFYILNTALVGTQLDNTLGYSYPLFIANSFNDSTLELDMTGAKSILEYLNGMDKSEVKIVRDYDKAITEMNKMVAYYNLQDVNDQATIFAYLNKYGFIRLVPTPTPGGDDDDDDTTGGAGAVSDTGEVFDIPTQLIPQSPFSAFEDMASHQWAQQAVERLFQFGIVNGKKIPSFTDGSEEIQLLKNGKVVIKTFKTRVFAGETGIYDPASNTTRAEFATLFVRLAGLPIVEKVSSFDDVPVTAWYNQYVSTVAEEGYMEAVKGNDFEPDRDITREEIAVTIGKILKENGKEVGVIDMAKFSDSDLVSSDVKEYIELCISEGIILGSEVDGKLFINSEAKATRAEIAVMLYRLANVIETEVYINPEVEEN